MVSQSENHLQVTSIYNIRDTQAQFLCSKAHCDSTFVSVNNVIQRQNVTLLSEAKRRPGNLGIFETGMAVFPRPLLYQKPTPRYFGECWGASPSPTSPEYQGDTSYHPRTKISCQWTFLPLAGVLKVESPTESQPCRLGPSELPTLMTSLSLPLSWFLSTKQYSDPSLALRPCIQSTVVALQRNDSATVTVLLPAL